MHSSYFIIALTDHKVVGTGSLDGPEIKHVFMDPDYQRRDIGRSIMEELERYAKNQGLKEVIVHSSVTAFEFYKELKYQLVEQSVMEYQGDTVITFFMKKCLWSARATMNWNQQLDDYNSLVKKTVHHYKDKLARY
jgi:N-acetylglutamate synthase-like GNAT family acetyltransferase